MANSYKVHHYYGLSESSEEFVPPKGQIMMHPCSAEPRSYLKKYMKKYRAYFALYNELQDRFSKSPLFLQHNLSYMSHLRKDEEDYSIANNHTNFLNTQNKENLQKNKKDSIIDCLLLNLDSLKGYTYAKIEYFMIQRNINDSSTADSKYYVGESDFSFYDKNISDEKSTKISFPFEALSNFDPNSNPDFKYSLGMLIRYFKSKERLGRTEDLEVQFKVVYDLDFGRNLFGERTCRLNKISTPTTTLTRDDKWTPIGPNDVFYLPRKLDSDYFERILNMNRNNLQQQEPLYFITFGIKSSDQSTVVPSSFSSSSQFNLSSRKITEIRLSVNPNERKQLTTFRKKKHKTVVYEFKCIQQCTLYTSFVCILCNIDCCKFRALYTHLKCCHPRFTVTFRKESNRTIFTLSLNDNFDAVHVDEEDAFPYLFLPRTKIPLMKKAQLYVMVSNEKRNQVQNLRANGYALDDAEMADLFRTSGFKRLYYHSQTGIPILPNEVEDNSEDEEYCEWLQRRSGAMIDEFTDVNSGEKTISKMWNWHLMKYSNSFLGEGHTPQACIAFACIHKDELIKKNMVKNFVMHLSNLRTFGAISPSLVEQIVLFLRPSSSNPLEFPF